MGFIINVASIAFWDEPLAKLIFITFMISAMLMMGLYSKYGFEKILGLGHILWVALIPYVLISLPVTDVAFNNYLIALLITISISLVFDVTDVWKYFSDKQTPNKENSLGQQKNAAPASLCR